MKTNLGRILFVLALVGVLCMTYAEPPHKIVIDGNFDDWIPVTRYTDPQDVWNPALNDSDQTVVLQDGVPDCHDTNSKGRCDVPSHVYNPIADLLEYGMAHDAEGTEVYVYLRATGDISKTANESIDGSAGRSYIQLLIDIDNNFTTGYCSNLGGYYPESCGYDMQIELEMYNGTFNTAHYLLHAMSEGNTTQFNLSRLDQIQGIVRLGPPPPEIGGYSPYTEWAYWLPGDPVSPDDAERCPDGPHTLPDGAHICFVQDKAPGPFSGSMEWAFSQDLHSVEFSAPWKGFLQHPDGTPLLQFGQTLTIAFALETSGEFSQPEEWISDMSWAVRGYTIDPPTGSSSTVGESSTAGDGTSGGVDGQDGDGIDTGAVVAIALSSVVVGVVVGGLGTLTGVWLLRRRFGSRHAYSSF